MTDRRDARDACLIGQCSVIAARLSAALDEQGLRRSWADFPPGRDDAQSRHRPTPRNRRGLSAGAAARRAELARAFRLTGFLRELNNTLTAGDAGYVEAAFLCPRICNGLTAKFCFCRVILTKCSEKQIQYWLKSHDAARGWGDLLPEAKSREKLRGCREENSELCCEVGGPGQVARLGSILVHITDMKINGRGGSAVAVGPAAERLQKHRYPPFRSTCQIEESM
jgi:hypothetical protein